MRLVSRIENDGKLITDPILGRMYASGSQKTFKSAQNVDEAVQRAKMFNEDLLKEIKGIVIVEFKRGKLGVATGQAVKPYIRTVPRKKGSTRWLRFIDKTGKVFLVDPDTHKVMN